MTPPALRAAMDALMRAGHVRAGAIEPVEFPAELPGGGDPGAPPPLRSAGRAKRRGPAWHGCPRGNLRVRVGSGGGGAAGAPEGPAPPPGRTERSPGRGSCSSSSQAASDAAARLARLTALSSSSRTDRELPFRVGGGGGGAAGAPDGPAPPPGRNERSPQRGACSSSSQAASGAASRLSRLTALSSSSGTDRDLPEDVEGGAGRPPYFDLVDAGLGDAAEGPSLGDGLSSGKRTSSTLGLGDLERAVGAPWWRRRRSRRSNRSWRNAAATADAILSSTVGHMATQQWRRGSPDLRAPLSYSDAWARH